LVAPGARIPRTIQVVARQGTRNWCTWYRFLVKA
jgi:hypothetical protein